MRIAPRLPDIGWALSWTTLTATISTECMRDAVISGDRLIEDSLERRHASGRRSNGLWSTTVSLSSSGSSWLFGIVVDAWVKQPFGPSPV